MKFNFRQQWEHGCECICCADADNEACEAANLIENFTGSAAFHISVDVLLHIGSGENKGPCYRGLPLVVENGNVFQFALDFYCVLMTLHPIISLDATVCYCNNDIAIDSVLIKDSGRCPILH